MVNGRAVSGIACLFWIPLALILSGCGAVATRTKFYMPVTDTLVAGNFTQAAAEFNKAKFDKKDRFLYFVDSGALYHYASEYDSSNIRLSSAENAADELFTRSISRAATSILLNDNVLEYSGEDYEILYTNLLKALNYLALNKFDDAFVEIRRADLKLSLLGQKYRDASDELQRGEASDTTGTKLDYKPGEVRFNNDALARYLGLHMYAAEGKWDDARIDYEKYLDAFLSQPEIYPFEPPDVVYGIDSGAVLSVVGLAGLCPVKEALNLRLRTDKDLGLVQVLYTDSENKDVEYGNLALPVKADYYFKFAIPKIAPRPSTISAIRIWANGNELGELGLLEDVGKIAEETFEAKKTLIYLRSVGRAVAKGLASHKLKEKVDTGDFVGWLKKVAVDVGSDISENADLRCARFLPGKIYAADFVVPPGTYNLKIEFIDSSGRVAQTDTIPNYSVTKDGFNLVRAFSGQ
ncbi:MAG TPA: hypothetical protein DCZ43_00410 [candidate division Zixibacteria bacterium]|nr:hypothetical protein [candidate division Zixibacteria bacterium]